MAAVTKQIDPGISPSVPVDFEDNCQIVKLALGTGVSTPMTAGQKTAANSLPVVIASDQGNISLLEAKTAVATVTSVSGSATVVTLLSANSSRKQALFSSNSTAIFYLKLGTGASLTSYTVKMYQDDYYEVPPYYTGDITGIWASTTGTVLVTEIV